MSSKNWSTSKNDLSKSFNFFVLLFIENQYYKCTLKVDYQKNDSALTIYERNQKSEFSEHLSKTEEFKASRGSLIERPRVHEKLKNHSDKSRLRLKLYRSRNMNISS